MAKNVSKLEQTRGSFRLQGKIVGINKDNAFTVGTTKKDNSKHYHSLRFGVKTNETNIINIEVFGAETDEIAIYRKEPKDTKKIPFADRKKALPEDYQMMGVKVTPASTEPVVKGKKSKAPSTTYIDYDAALFISQNFNDGDSVQVSGTLQPNSYSNAQGVIVSNFKYVLKNIFALNNEIDFEDKKFAEMASFETEIIVTEPPQFNKEKDKIIVNAYSIGYADTFKEIQLAIHYDKNKQLGDNFLKLKFGDYIKVLGICINQPSEQEVVTDEWGSEMPKGYGKFGSTYINELRITAVAKDADGNTCYKKRKYTQDDFVKVEEDEVDTSDEPDFGNEEDKLPF